MLNIETRNHSKEYRVQGGLVRVLVLDTCSLVCAGPGGNYRCEEQMQSELSFWFNTSGPTLV